MLEEVLYLTPQAEESRRAWVSDAEDVPVSDPPIMIPGIAEDGSLYPIEKMKAHIEGLHHLALSVFIFAGDELLIQRRAHGKYHCGGQWANTCCTHPHIGEDIEIAATRRLQEELGFTVPLTEMRIVEYSADVGNGLWERERVHMFRADVSKDEINPNLNPSEVAEVRWISALDLHAEIKSVPDDFTPWFRIYVNRFPALDFSS